MFEVRITHDEDGNVDAIVFEGTDFYVQNNPSRVRIWLDDEARMNWHRVKMAVGDEPTDVPNDYAETP